MINKDPLIGRQFNIIDAFYYDAPSIKMVYTICKSTEDNAYNIEWQDHYKDPRTATGTSLGKKEVKESLAGDRWFIIPKPNVHLYKLILKI